MIKLVIVKKNSNSGKFSFVSEEEITEAVKIFRSMADNTSLAKDYKAFVALTYIKYAVRLATWYPVISSTRIYKGIALICIA